MKCRGTNIRQRETEGGGQREKSLSGTGLVVNDADVAAADIGFALQLPLVTQKQINKRGKPKNSAYAS